MERKTQRNTTDVGTFIDALQHPGRRADARVLLELMSAASGEPPAMWGASIVGFGRYHYQYASGREGDMPLVGFAPRKANMVVYVMPGFDAYETLLPRLGKHRHGKSCLYLGRLDGINLDVLRELVTASVAYMRNKYT